MLELLPTKVATGTDDEEGFLVYEGERLCAVLVRLDSDVHGEMRGRWYVEHGFGVLQFQTPEPFMALDEAKSWISGCLERGRDG